MSKLIAHYGRNWNRNWKWTYAQFLSIVNQTTIHRHKTHAQWKRTVPYLCLYVTTNRDRRHISNRYVLRARLHMTYNDPTETLRLNERPVTEGHCTVMPHVSRGTTRPDLEENAGNLGEGSEAVNASGQAKFWCLSPAAQRSGNFWPTLLITVAPCTSPITLFSMYNVMVVSQYITLWF